MRVDILSKEYPPAIYGGAGVHVAELVRALRARGDMDVQVRCFGTARDETGTTAYPDLPELAGGNAAMQTLGVDVSMAGDCVGADLVHSHTWYANMAGHLASLLGGMPHVVTAHSLEPMRPVEGRAARWRLPRVLVGRAHRLRVRCRRRGSQCGHARGHPQELPVARPGAGSRGAQRDRLAAVVGGPLGRGHRDRSAPWSRPRQAVGGLRRPHHPPEGPALPAEGVRAAAARRPARPLRRGARHAGDPRGGRGARERAAIRTRGCRLDP